MEAVESRHISPDGPHLTRDLPRTQRYSAKIFPHFAGIWMDWEIPRVLYTLFAVTPAPCHDPAATDFRRADWHRSRHTFPRSIRGHFGGRLAIPGHVRRANSRSRLKATRCQSATHLTMTAADPSVLCRPLPRAYTFHRAPDRAAMQSSPSNALAQLLRSNAKDLSMNRPTRRLRRRAPPSARVCIHSDLLPVVLDHPRCLLWPALRSWPGSWPAQLACAQTAVAEKKPG